MNGKTKDEIEEKIRDEEIQTSPLRMDASSRSRLLHEQEWKDAHPNADCIGTGNCSSGRHSFSELCL